MVKTQYIRYSQDYTVVLVASNDKNEPYLPVGKHSIYQPESSISFLNKTPVWVPNILPFVPWVYDFKSFFKRLDYFEGEDFVWVKKDWRSFATSIFPTDA